MQFPFASLLVLASFLGVKAKPVPYSTSDGIVVQTSPTDSPEAQAEQQNSNKVTCQDYSSSNLFYKSIAPCESYCGGLSKSKDTSTGSVTCLSLWTGVTHVEYQHDSDGNEYVAGVCKCDIPLLDDLVDDLAKGFALLGEIGCSIFFETLDDVLQIATLVIPGAGEIDAADAGMQAAVKIAKAVADKGQDALDFVNGFTGGPCSAGTNYTDSADNLFLPLIGKGKPGKGIGKKPPPPKPADKPSTPDKPKPNDEPKPSDKPSETPSKTEAPKTTTSDTPKTTSTTSKDEKSTKSSDISKATASSKSSLATSSSTSSSLSSSSSSSSAPACSGTQSSAAKPTKGSSIGSHDVYRVPNDCEVQQILDYLKNYDSSQTKKDKLIDTIIIPKYMSNSHPAADSSMFYVGQAAVEAATQKDINEKQTVASVFHGYGKFPFDVTMEPMKSITAQKMQKTWFRATSAAYARVSSGKAFLVYNGNWKTAKGGDGAPSIFNTDELPELKKNGQVKSVYQISTALASLWDPDNEPTLKLIGDITGVNPTNGQLPAEQIWPENQS